MFTPRFFKWSAVAVVLVSFVPLSAWSEGTSGPMPTIDLPPGNWKLVFEEEFNGDRDSWKERWISDAAAHKHILSSRWPENVVAEDGRLRLLARKESRAGKEWTTGSVWTKQKFEYGYFEARYRYAAAPALNNSFWLMNHKGMIPPEKLASGERCVFEIDVNEGHYPNKISTNIHRWTPKHMANSRSIVPGANPLASFPLEIPVTTGRLRVVCTDALKANIAEIRAFAPTKEGYPAMADEAGNPLPLPADRPNVLAGAKVTASSVLRPEFAAQKAADGVAANHSRWVSSNEAPGPHELVLDLPKPVTIGCLQIFTGWRDRGQWSQPMANYAVQYWNGSEWVDIVKTGGAQIPDLSKDFHTYGLLWTPQELVFYFDGKEIRREPNEFCHGEAPVFLSLAVIHWAGPVTDRIDGTSQDAEYVRIWQEVR